MGGGRGGGAATGEGEGGRWAGAGRRSPRTLSPFPVRTAGLFPNLPPSAPSRPGKAPGRSTAVPRCADRRACRDGRAPAGTRPSAPGPPAASGKAGAARSRAPLRPSLCSRLTLTSQWGLRSCRLSLRACHVLHPGGGGLLPSSLSSFGSFSYLFLFNNEFLMTQAIDEYTFLFTR